MSTANERQRSTKLPREKRGRCSDADIDLRTLLSSWRPLGDTTAITRHAATCRACFSRINDLFLATAPEASDPSLRLVNGLNQALYQLAKSLLYSVAGKDAAAFCFDSVPISVDEAVSDALDRLAAIDEFSDGQISMSEEAEPIRTLIGTAVKTGHPLDHVDTLLKRSVSIGGRYGLDAANLLGFLRYRQGDLEGAELLLHSAITREAEDRYERETQAHAMNNLTGVFVGKKDMKSAILWSERSLMLKKQLGLDTRSNNLNLLCLWLDNDTAYGRDRARFHTRSLLLLDDGKNFLEESLKRIEYLPSVTLFRTSGLEKEFPEVRLPTDPRQKTLKLQKKKGKRAQRSESGNAQDSQ